MSWTMLFLLNMISGLCCQPLLLPSGNNKIWIFHNKSKCESAIIKDKSDTKISLKRRSVLFQCFHGRTRNGIIYGSNERE